MHWLRYALAAIVIALASSGCAPDDTLPLRTWTLVAEGVPPTPITLPSHFDRALPGRESVYELHATVALPPSYRDRPLTLAVPFFQARMTLYADDELAPILDLPRSGDYRSAGAQRFRIVPHGREQLELVLRVQHTWVQSAWFDCVPRISPTLEGDSTFLLVRMANDGFAAGAFAGILFASVIYAFIFLASRRHTAAAWFALEGFSGATYPAFMLGISQTVFGRYDGLSIGVGLSIATLSNVEFVHRHAGLGPVSRGWHAALGLSLLTFALAPGPFRMTYWAAPTTVSLMVANAAYQSVVSVRLLRTSTLNVAVVAMAFPVANVFAVADLLAWVGFGEFLGGLRLGVLGIGIISLTQAIALSRDYIVSSHHAEELNRELASRVDLLELTNREVRVLNDELRRQIGARSERLVDALARLSGDGTAIPELRSGMVLDTRYRVVRRLGSGGMGTVYEVERLTDGRHLALKVLSHAGSYAAVARFAREAQIIAQLSHEHVVSIYDIDISEGGLLYIVMELVAGRSLREDTPMEARAALAIVRQVADALAAIHARGIIHRDLKPENVLVDSEEGPIPHVKIADFGISGFHEVRADEARSSRAPASLSGDTDGPTVTIAPHVPLPKIEPALREALDESARTPGNLTQAGMIMGTPRYMAPEVASGADLARPASDVFSLGVIAYELLTGDGPYAPGFLAAVLAGDPIPPPRSLASVRPDLPRGVADLLTRCVAVAPSRRPSAAEVAKALDAYRAPEVSVGPALVATARTS